MVTFQREIYIFQKAHRISFFTLCASINAPQFSSPLSMTHSSLALFVSGHAQQGFTPVGLAPVAEVFVGAGAGHDMHKNKRSTCFFFFLSVFFSNQVACSLQGMRRAVAPPSTPHIRRVGHALARPFPRPPRVAPSPSPPQKTPEIDMGADSTMNSIDDAVMRTSQSSMSPAPSNTRGWKSVLLENEKEQGICESILSLYPT